MNQKLHIIKGIVLTEKASLLREQQNQYIFNVELDANRHDVCAAISQVFGVIPRKVNIMRYDGKSKRLRGGKKGVGKTARVKKAIVFLGKDDRIDLI